MKKNIIFILFCFISLAVADDKNTFLKDLDFIYNSIQEHHPGVHNKLDPNFIKNMNVAYKKSRAKISESVNAEKSKQCINEFAKSFNDAHLWVSWKNKKKTTYNNQAAKFSISELNHGVAWVTLPTFDLPYEQRKIFDETVKEIKKLRNKNDIIFDLRGNTGGNSNYGNQIAKALFGNDYLNLKMCEYSKNIYVDWRATEDNLDHMKQLSLKFPDQTWIKTTSSGIQKALLNNKNYYRVASNNNCSTNKKVKVKTEAKIIVIIDSYNVSAALDFIDTLKLATNNVVLIGKKTKADSLYMEVRTVNLPSNLGKFSFPIKVFRNRKRGNKEPYIPDVKFDEIHDNKILEDFISNYIKNDL